MKTIACVALATLLGSASVAFAASRADQTFMTNAIQGDLAEIQMGQLAQQKGQSQQVKSFGQMLVTDHQANKQQADQLAQQIGMAPPTAPNAEQKADYDKLSKLSGTTFDRRFAAMMVTDHEKTIRQFRQEARKGNEAIRGFAKQSLPVLEKHLSAARKIEHAKTAAR